MSIPFNQKKYQSEAIFNPTDYLEYQRKQYGKKLCAPSSIVFCYQKSLFKSIKENFKTTMEEGLLVVDYNSQQVGVCGNFGVGAPGATLVFEDMIAKGASKFISIGSAGSLQANVKVGDIVVLDRAIRDEGTSSHYLPYEKYAFASTELTAAIEKRIECPFHKGSSWTTDAPYRETLAEVKEYQKEGVLAVEMEAAALFAVANYRNVELGALVMISDSLADFRWNPCFDDIKKGQMQLFRIALDALTKE